MAKSYGLVMGSINWDKPGSRRGFGSFFAWVNVVSTVAFLPPMAGAIVYDEEKSPAQKAGQLAVMGIVNAPITYLSYRYLRRPK